MPRIFYDVDEMSGMTNEELEVMRLKYKEKKERYSVLINENFVFVSEILDLVNIEICRRKIKNNNINAQLEIIISKLIYMDKLSLEELSLKYIEIECDLVIMNEMKEMFDEGIKQLYSYRSKVYSIMKEKYKEKYKEKILS